MNKLPDLTSRYLPDIQNYQIPGLSLGNDLILPDYNGRSILNIPSTICRAFGIPGLSAPPLDETLLAQIDRQVNMEDIQRIVLILMDGLSLQRLRKWMEDGHLPILSELLQEGVLLPLTSIAPCTTSAALTSLWTGRSPAEHGIVGYEMWMKEYGMVVNTIVHAPMSYKNDIGSLVKAGFKPEEFIPFPTLGTHLLENDVQPYAFQHYSISRSGLSKMLFKDAAIQAFTTASDLWVNLLQLIESKPEERIFAWVYWGEVDYFSHRYGPDDSQVLIEFSHFCHALQQSLILPIKQREKDKTLLILAADHGEIVTYKNPLFELRNHPALIQRLHIMPTGENRMAYLHIRPGQVENVLAYIEQTWGNQFSLLKSQQALKAGLFGAGKRHPQLNDRIGEFIVIAHEDAYLWWAEKDNHLQGRHGGLSADEMLVPFIAVKI